MKKKSLRRLNKPFEANLRALWREFKRCSQMYRPLYSDQLTFFKPSPFQPWLAATETTQPVEDANHWDDLDKPLSEESWLAFTKTHQPGEAANEWWVWERVPFGKEIHRYSGCPDGLEEFRKLAESAAILFEEMEIFEKAVSHHSWTHFLHWMAACYQMPLLRSKQILPAGMGNYEIRSKAPRSHPPYLVAPDEPLEIWFRPVFGEIPNYPSNWITRRLIHNVFTSSMTLIEAVLDPDSVVYVSFLTDRSSMDAVLGPPEVAPDDEATVNSSDFTINFPPNKNIFKHVTGKTWFIQFVEGGIESERGHIDGTEGFYLIQKVLSSDKQPVSPIDLYAAIPEKGIELSEADDKLRRAKKDADDEGMPRRRSGSGTGVFDMADPEAIKDYRNRRKELLAFIEQAQPNVEIKKLDDAQKELDFINKELTSVTNLTGKPRSFPLGTPEEAARHRVKTSWSRALKLLRESKKFDKLSEFLDLYLKTQGAQGRQYMKAGEVKWET